MRPFVVSLLLLACAPALAQPAKPAFLGEKRPAGVPRRVVSLAPSVTEILFALGEGEKIVGVTRYDDHPEEVKELPRVGGFIDPSLEAILALRPDLVVCVPHSGGRGRMDALARMGVAVLVLPAFTLEDVFTAIDELGALFSKKSRAAKLIARMRDRIEAVKRATRDRPHPRALLVYGHKPVVAAGSGSFADNLLTLAGGRNVVVRSRVPYPTLPMEEIIRLSPEVIIDASASGTGAEMSSDEVQQGWSRWRILPAVRSGRIHVFDSALWFRPGPRVVEGLERLAGLLHPDLDLEP